jgi:hypothetical protein
MCSDGGTSHSTDEALLIGVEFCALRDAGQRTSFALQQRALGGMVFVAARRAAS